MKDPHSVPVVFINELSGSGFLNGVINLTLATAQFTPDGETVDVDLIVGSRLRFDLMVAQQIHTALGSLLEQNTKPAPGEKVN